MSKTSEPKQAKSSEPTLGEKMQKELSDRFLPMLDAVRKDRKSHFDANPVPDRTAVPAMISSYSYKCASIAGACNLVPGPWGLIAVVPEISLILREQLRMVYDIGRAYGHGNITQELLLGIVLSGAGAGTGGLIVVHGGKVVVKRASLRLIQKLVVALGGKVTQKVLRSMLAKWVPILGAAAMAVWAKYSTKKLGQLAAEIFSKDIVLEDDVLDIAATPEIHAEEKVQGPGVLVERIRLMIAMAWMDRRLDGSEREFVANLFDDPDLSPEARQELQASLDSGKVGAIDYKAFKGRDDEKISTIMDMIALMQVDGSVHPAERLLVRQVSKEFGLPDADVEAMMEAQP